MTKTKIIKIHYYALLREERGLSEERVETTASNPQYLYRELKKKHGFRLDTDVLKVAINDEFSDWKDRLNDGDSVVFIPPVAGG